MIDSKQDKIKELIKWLDIKRDVASQNEFEDLDVVLNVYELDLIIDGLKVLGFALFDKFKKNVDFSNYYPKCFKCRAVCLGNEVLCNKCSRDSQDNVRELDLLKD